MKILTVFILFWISLNSALACKGVYSKVTDKVSGKLTDSVEFRMILTESNFPKVNDRDVQPC